jgi:hypothetical protein
MRVKHIQTIFLDAWSIFPIIHVDLLVFGIGSSPPDIVICITTQQATHMNDHHLSAYCILIILIQLTICCMS